MFPNFKLCAGDISVRLGKQLYTLSATSRYAIPICAMLAIGAVCCLYASQNNLDGEPFAWFDGISAWPSIAINLFAALCSVHFIIKAHFILRQDAAKLAAEFGFNVTMPDKTSFFGWDKSPTRPAIPRSDSDLSRQVQIDRCDKIEILALWQRYLCRGRLWMRALRVAPMTGFYMAALFAGLPLLGQFPPAPIRGPFASHFVSLMMPTFAVFLFLTFFVIDAILLHDGFLKQFTEKATCWPDSTFQKYKYPIRPNRPGNEVDLADYWDILLIARRTEAVGSLIYYPFIVLSLLIAAGLPCFDNWTWPPVVMVAFGLHFAVAFYAAWQLPKVAREYRDKVLERLKRRKRQALMIADKTPEAIDTMIEEVQSTHQGAFANIWDQPAIRALLLPSGGIGVATLLQYLPH